MICCPSAVNKCPFKRKCYSIFSKECLVFGNNIPCPFKNYCLAPCSVPLGPSKNCHSEWYDLSKNIVKRNMRHCKHPQRLYHNIKWVSRLVSKLWRYVLECWGLWLCNSADNIRSKKKKMAGMWPWLPKKFLKWEKAKIILFHSKLILSTFFVKRLTFWQHQRWAVVAAVNLI